MTTQKDYDVSHLFGEDNQNSVGVRSAQPERERQRSERVDAESFYLVVSSHLLAFDIHHRRHFYLLKLCYNTQETVQ